MMTFNPGHENSTRSITVPSCLDAGQVAQWVVSLTHNVSVIGSIPIKGLRCFLEQEILTVLLSTGWFQEQIQVRFHNQTKIN